MKKSVVWVENEAERYSEKVRVYQACMRDGLKQVRWGNSGNPSQNSSQAAWTLINSSVLRSLDVVSHVLWMTQAIRTAQAVWTSYVWGFRFGSQNAKREIKTLKCVFSERKCYAGIMTASHGNWSLDFVSNTLPVLIQTAVWRKEPAAVRGRSPCNESSKWPRALLMDRVRSVTSWNSLSSKTLNFC